MGYNCMEGVGYLLLAGPALAVKGAEVCPGMGSRSWQVRRLLGHPLCCWRLGDSVVLGDRAVWLCAVMLREPLWVLVHLRVSGICA